MCNIISSSIQAKFHPEIDSPEEESVRKAQFAKAHKMIQEHNSDPEATHHLTHNHFSSMVTYAHLFKQFTLFKCLKL